MSDVIIGIDPGVTGAISRFVNNKLTNVADIPADVSKEASKGADIRDLIGGSKDHTVRHVTAAGIVKLLKEWSDGHSVEAYIEKVGARPNQGIVSTTRFLRVANLFEGICVTLGIPLHLVDPSVWKRKTGTPTDKDEARLHAIQLFPDWEKVLKRKGDHNRAEAILIGAYGVLVQAHR